MPERPDALVFRTAGTNCDAEMVRAFEMAGARAHLVHVDALIRDPSALERADLLGFPGGFSYGDDIGAGRVFASRLREHLWPALRSCAERGVLMIGACNGFQVLVQCGLLPGFDPGSWPVRAPEAGAALADNASARFIDAWPRVAYPGGSVCVWTRGLGEVATPDSARLPIAHGEGRFVTGDDDLLAALEANAQVAVRYVDNPNASAGDIAGICDPSGRIFGLMPHPERFLDWNRHPFWTRLDARSMTSEAPGLRMFRNAVRAAGVASPAAG